ncbi:MAG: NAD-dependent epimerase/dehydratase family protein [Phycisphaera sp.]|nr:NAD-dependent epimerase/dehydratase family protein [Phycisphaera sp.]
MNPMCEGIGPIGPITWLSDPVRAAVEVYAPMTPRKEPRPSPTDVGKPVTLLVGTTTSVRELAAILVTVEPSAAVIGCLLPQGDGERCASRENDRLQCLGSFADLEKIAGQHRVARVLVSLPVAMTEPMLTLVRRLDSLRVEGQQVDWRFLPTWNDQLAGRIAAPLSPFKGASREGGAARYVLPPGTSTSLLDTATLIDRQPKPLDRRAIARVLTGKRVLITGSGGSIGSEIARIVASFEPAQLLLVERAENALFEIDRLIARQFPRVPRKALLHDITDAPRTESLFAEHRPQAVFHAAAHKHVPMMEDHPSAAVENNFFGTRSVVDAACEYGAEHFVMISTDKAVNPSSVMGATKRLAELYVQYQAGRSQTILSMVRFGNVLGSACSVLPIWSQQLSGGLPITVTHPDMTRYFMTIPEAAGLVLQSAALAQGGEVFLLDMGQPIRIVDLARRFIQSHGLTPDDDVPIVYTGIRPGEKLFEELAYDSEDMAPTAHASVRIWRMIPPEAARIQKIIQTFDALRRRSASDTHLYQHATREAIHTALRDALPEMIAKPLAA